MKVEIDKFDAFGGFLFGVMFLMNEIINEDLLSKTNFDIAIYTLVSFMLGYVCIFTGAICVALIKEVKHGKNKDDQ